MLLYVYKCGFFVNSKLCNVANKLGEEKRVKGIHYGLFGFKRYLVCGNDRMIASRWEISSYLAAVAAAFVDTCADKENLQ